MPKRLSEHALIDSLRAASSGTTPRGLVVGSGDDAAVFRGSASGDFVVTQDALVEGQHFERRWFTGRQLGWRLAAVNLSDVAAMGATPRFALISFGVPRNVRGAYLRAIQSGAARHLAKFSAAVVGGNVAGTSGPLTCDMTLIGVCRRGKAWTRRARAEDAIVVAGELGNARAGLSLLQASRGRAGGKLVDAYRRPRPLLDVASLLSRETAVHAAIDVSDGFSSDLIHMCRSGGVGCTVEADALRASRALAAFCARSGTNPLDEVLAGGEDYALVLSVAASRTAAVCSRIEARLGIPAYVAGRFHGRRGVYRLAKEGGSIGLSASGWDHLRR